MTAPRWSRALPLVALALTTLALGVIYRRVFAGELAGDDNTFHWAEVVRISDGLRHGDLDWWNPSANAGFPTGYYYQLLPALAPGALAAIFGHPLFWFQFAIWLPLVLTPAAGYRALRVLDVEPWPAFGGGLAIPLTANMHTPKLIDLFLRDRINRVVLSFMALGAAHVLFVAYIIGPRFAPLWSVRLAD